MTQFENMCFFEINDLKLTLFELFSLRRFKDVSADASELFRVTLLANNERFLYQANCSLLIKNYICM